MLTWMRTPDDGGCDGRFRAYLDAPETWAKYDRELFSGLKDLLRLSPRPSVSLIEESRLLTRTTYYSEKVPDDRNERDIWREKLFDVATDKDFVFLDPDNGIEVPSKPVGRKGSSKFVTWCEIEKLWQQGCSVIIYQHFRRERREAFALRMLSELQWRTSAPRIEALRTSHVLFLLAAHQKHDAQVRGALSLLDQRWNKQITVMDFADKLR